MQDKDKYKRAEEYSADRCEQNVTIGKDQRQCNLVKVPGSKYCQIHGGNKVEQNQIRHKADMYRLTKYKASLEHFKGSNDIKNLSEEIGILRIVMEETLESCSGTSELLCYSDKIANLASQIQRLVESAHKLDLSLGQYLDKTQALNLIEIILTIINKATIPDNIKENISDLVLVQCKKAIDESQQAIMK